jgi:opacity protein-like surface antigen
MTGRYVLATVALVSLCTLAQAQDEDKRFEISANAGWTFSDGVGGSAEDRFGNEFASIDPDDAFSWSLRAGYMINPNVEFGALFGVQSSSLGISVRPGTVATSEFSLGDETLYNYHGYFAYNFGESTKVRPYLLLGLGATHFGAVSVDTVNIPVPHDAAQREIGGSTKFSSTWAAGLKLFPSSNIGLRIEGRWTPTYIKTDAEGWWCDPYWGCYTAGDAQYANQYEVGGGIALRF